MNRLNGTLSATLILIVASTALSPAAFAAMNNGSGPSQSQIDCQNRAVNDYWDNVKSCEKALSDLPSDLAQCKSDAKDDMNRQKSQCVNAARLQGKRTIDGIIKRRALKSE